MDVRIDGRVALITGGSRGLGRAMALKFAESGADVAIAARRPDMLEEARAEIAGRAQSQVRAYACDVSDGPFEDLTDEVWQADLDLKLFAAIRLARLALPGMKQRRWGRIINILNIAAKAPRPQGAPTAVSRAAGLALTKVLAGDGAPHNVLVNALLTGSIVTDQVVRRHKRLELENTLEEYIADSGKGIPLGRMGTAEEYVSAQAQRSRKRRARARRHMVAHDLPKMKLWSGAATTQEPLAISSSICPGAQPA
ncbi:MAG: SDR family NAD(P)-dependent oxidoreductase [Alphaproteobacteria bacterium]